MMSKSARLSLSLLFPTLALLGLYSLISLGQNAKSNGNSQKENAQHPGYYEQWFQEKKDANGQIPAFLRSQWAQYDAKKLDRRAGKNPI
ncbi:MAG: hypothetical protein NTZ00_05265, partial [Bacteroidetes bacterium]|nr:hypothetical protein [Bacteroidota bacterium]